jgi:magnesium transporter
MVNTLYLPEIREMLQDGESKQLLEFCTALHPARTAEFMEGLSADESWQVLMHADLATRVEIFSYFEHDKQLDILSTQNRDQLAELIGQVAADDRVDVLDALDEEIVKDLLSRLHIDDRRDILRLSQYPEGTAGSMMTSQFAQVHASCTVRQALEELSRQAEELETIYYLYIIDDDDHLQGVVSARRLVASMTRPDRKLSDLMETKVMSVNVAEDQEEVINRVAKLDLLAIPVVDDQYRVLGIITHDDVIDAMREVATEDAHRAGAVNPLEDSYLKTAIFTLCWKRGIWLVVLFFFAQLTALALSRYDAELAMFAWLIPFIPLVTSSGGNTGSQSATLIITALSQGHVTVRDWRRIAFRELLMGVILGSVLGAIGYMVALVWGHDSASATVIPITLLFVVVAGTITGSALPLIFKRIGWDPALMSNPLVAGIVDILGIVIYLNVAILLLAKT